MTPQPSGWPRGSAKLHRHPPHTTSEERRPRPRGPTDGWPERCRGRPARATAGLRLPEATPSSGSLRGNGAIGVQPIHDDSTKRIVHSVELLAADLSVDRG